MRKILFMLDKVRRDLQTPRQRYPLCEDVHNPQLAEYYFVFDEERVRGGKDQALIKRFDENGIPINKTYVDVTDQDYVYFPISIGQLGLAVFHTWLKTKDSRDLERFLKFGDWFMQHAVVDELGARWLTQVPLPQYRSRANWASAFSQARGLNILLRAYQTTGRQDYAEMAEKALIAFERRVGDGGVVSDTSWGPFYEEYTSEVPTLVLNGMIFALFGVYDFVRAFPEHKRAREIFDKGVQTLIKALPAYDLGFWSRYNLCNAEWYPSLDPATIQYQRLHIAQLELLHRITQNEFFKEYAEKFRQQDTLLNAGRAYVSKFASLRKLNRL